MAEAITIPLVPKKKMDALGEIHDIVYVSHMGKTYYPFPFKNRFSSYGLRALDIASEFIDKEFDRKELDSACNILDEYVPVLREYERLPGKKWDEFQKQRSLYSVDKAFTDFVDDSYTDTLSELSKKVTPPMEAGLKAYEKDGEFSRILSGLCENHGECVVPINDKIKRISDSCSYANRRIDDIYSNGLEGFYSMDERGRKNALKKYHAKEMSGFSETLADKITSKTIFHPKIAGGTLVFGLTAAALGTSLLSYAVLPASEEARMPGSMAYWQYANPEIADAMATDLFMHTVLPVLAVAAVGFKGYLDAYAVNKDKKNLDRITEALKCH